MKLPISASLRGPIFGSMFPAHAADTPRVKMAMLNAQAVSVCVQPIWRTRIV